MFLSKSKQRSLAPSLSALLLLVLTQVHSAQYASVRSITARTIDGIGVSARLESTRIIRGDDVTIEYEIENRGVSAVYFVRKKGIPNVVVEGDVLELPFFIFHSADSSDYRYEFLKVAKGKRVKGKLVFTSNLLVRNRTWLINAAFAFVDNPHGLDRELGPTEDPLPYRELLSNSVRTLGINGLVIRVEEDE
jgi:hypothetical protein